MTLILLDTISFFDFDIRTNFEIHSEIDFANDFEPDFETGKRWKRQHYANVALVPAEGREGRDGGIHALWPHSGAPSTSLQWRGR